MTWRRSGPAARQSREPWDLVAVRRCADSPGPRSYPSLQRGERLLESPGEPAHDLADLFICNDEGWSDHHEIAVGAVGVPHIGPHSEAGVECGIGKSLGKFCLAWQRGAAGFVFHEFDAGEEAAPPDIADMRQVGQQPEPLVQHAPHPRAALDELVLLQVAHSGYTGGAGDRVMRK